MEPYADWTGKLTTRIREGERLSRPSRCPPALWTGVALLCFNVDPKARPTFEVLYRKLQAQLEASETRGTAAQASAVYVCEGEDDGAGNHETNAGSLYDSNDSVRIDNSSADLESSAYSVHMDN